MAAVEAPMRTVYSQYLLFEVHSLVIADFACVHPPLQDAAVERSDRTGDEYSNDESSLILLLLPAKGVAVMIGRIVVDY